MATIETNQKRQVEVTCGRCSHHWYARYLLWQDFERCPACGQGWTGLAYNSGIVHYTDQKRPDCTCPPCAAGDSRVS